MVNDTVVKEEDFTLVTSRKGRRSKPSRVTSIITNCKENSVSSLDEDFVIKRIKQAEQDLNDSEYLQRAFTVIRSHLKPLGHRQISQIHCIGIGHFGDCLISRYQLAFILAIKKEFSIERITFHEPILSRSEVNILQRINCEVCAENLEAKIQVDTQAVTLVYSPHCPKQLTNNLLWRNWNHNRLTGLVFIGNSFKTLLESTPNRLLAQDARFIIAIEPYCHETVLENCFKFTDTFNDTAVHTFPGEQLSKLPNTFWTEAITEPTYSDNIELITSELIAKLTF